MCQDDANTTPGGSGNQDFKFVRLEKILTGLLPPPPPGPDTPPDTLITSGPSGSVTSSSATLEFTSTKAGSTFACSLDGAAPSPCTSPQTYNALPLGGHRFEVAATDAAGTDPSPAVRTWTRVEASSGPLTLAPTDDARVEKNNPNTKYGTSTMVGADSSPVMEGFLRFNVPATGTAITGARLRLWVTDMSEQRARGLRVGPGLDRRRHHLEQPAHPHARIGGGHRLGVHQPVRGMERFVARHRPRPP